MRARTLLLLALLAAVVAISGGSFGHLYNDSRVLQPYDYLEYWSAGRANLAGQNPYDGAVLFPMQTAVGTAWEEPIMMWNPPWVLPVAMSLGAVHWRTGQLAWFALNLAAVLASAVMLWRMYGGDPRRTWLAAAVSLLFAPTLFMLLLGQITGLMLLGLVAFVWFVRGEKYLLAGGLAALTSIKPHLLAPFALVLILQALYQRNIRKSVLCGGAVILLFALIPMVWNPDVWRQYREATSSTSANSHHTLSDWQHPTLGYAIRDLLPHRPFTAMFVPLILVLPVVAWHWWTRRQTWNWNRELPQLVILSLLAAPYGAWGNDLVLLVVPVVQAASWILADRRAWLWGLQGGAYVVLNLALLSTVTREHSMCNPWIVPVTAAGYLLVRWCTRLRPPECSRDSLHSITQPALT